MRILVVNANRDVVGGAETYLRSLMPALRGRGHEIGLLVERHAASGTERIDGPNGADRTWSVADEGDRAASQAIGWMPDVAFVHGIGSPTLERSIVTSIPSILFAHSYHGTCPTGTKRHAFPHTHFCRRRLGPMCIVLHYPRRCGGLDPSTMLADYRRQRDRRDLLSAYRAVLVASEHMAAEYRRHGVPPDRLHVAPLPPTGIEAADAPVTVRNPHRLVFAGRLTNLKGVDVLLRALPPASRSLRRPLRLRVVGDGPERNALEALAARLDLHVDFVGWAKREHLNVELGAAHLAVMPSTWPEPWGLTGIEAGLAGIPTAAFAAGGIPEWLEHGETGMLAPADPPTAEGLADAIAGALGDDWTYARLARGAWTRARRFSMDAHVAQVAEHLARAAR